MPPKHEYGGKKRPQNHKVGAESAPAQIRAEKVRRSEKSHGGGKCHQNGKAEAENATKQAK